MDQVGQGGLHQLFGLPWSFSFVNFIPLKIRAEPADSRCVEVKHASIQPTWNIHPFTLKWAHSYWAHGYGRRCLLTVAVSSFNFLAVKKVLTMSVQRLVPPEFGTKNLVKLTSMNIVEEKSLSNVPCHFSKWSCWRICHTTDCGRFHAEATDSTRPAYWSHSENHFPQHRRCISLWHEALFCFIAKVN